MSEGATPRMGLQDLKELQAAPGRACGSCSMCCKLLLVDELGKPAHQWCRHCRPGNGGCTIYPTRPLACRAFACEWLINPLLGDEWQPSRSKMVMLFAKPNGSYDQLVLIVDPGWPDVWQRAPYHKQIRNMAVRGLRGDITGSLCTTIVVGKTRWLILPHRDVDITNARSLSLLGGGPDHWEVQIDME
jgi:hypothetical protein